MRFVDPALSIHFDLRKAEAFKILPDFETVSFLAFLTDYKESAKPEWDSNQQNQYNPQSPIRQIKSYFKELNMSFDVLAETEQEVKNNKVKILKIYKHIPYGFEKNFVTFDPFDLRFAGLLFNKKYCGYITSFDAVPDLEKGYWLDSGILYPKAYKVSFQFVVTKDDGQRVSDFKTAEEKALESRRASAAAATAASAAALAALAATGTGATASSPAPFIPANVWNSQVTNLENKLRDYITNYIDSPQQGKYYNYIDRIKLNTDVTSNLGNILLGVQNGSDIVSGLEADKTLKNEIIVLTQKMIDYKKTIRP